MQLHANLAAVFVPQQRPYTRFNRSSCTVIKMINTCLRVDPKPCKRGVSGPEDRSMKVRWCPFEEKRDIRSASGRLCPDRSAHGEAAFIHEKPQAYCLRHKKAAYNEQQKLDTQAIQTLADHCCTSTSVARQ
jgi:hypothetical protein